MSFKRRLDRILVVMEMFCIFTESMSISFCDIALESDKMLPLEETK